VLLLELPEARAFAFGIVLAAAVGPIALIIATNSLRFGFGSGVRSALGAALGDLTYATLAAAAGATIQTIVSEHARQIHFAASFGLSLFGMFLIVQACRASMPAAGIEQAQVSTPHGGFRSTYVLTLVNPITVIFFGGFIAQLPHGFAVRRLATVVASLFMGSLVVQVGIAAGGAVVGSRIRDERWIRILNVASGIGLTAFGLFGLF
jgi:threonine/homoserine/homoserine lactone efflux protein